MNSNPSTRPGRAPVWTLLLLLTLTLLLAACGGASDDDAGDAAEATQQPQSSSRSAAPTMPVARFTAVVGEVDLTKVAESANEGTPEAADGPNLALGESAYGRLCAECHGDAGEGVAAKGEAITGMELDEAAFDTLLRTGGGNGNEHIFGPTKISDDGIAALFAFVQTLKAE